MIKEKLEKICRDRFTLLAGIILLMGTFMTLTNLSVLLKFQFFSRTMEDLSVDSLRSGICIKDDFSYTYGNIGEWIGRKTTKIYLVDMGSEHKEYAELLVEQNSYYGKENDFEKLHTFYPGNYRELNTKYKVKMYAIVRKANRKTMAYDLFSHMFETDSGEKNGTVSTDYQIETVNPNEYKMDLIAGIFFLVTGAVLFFYVKKRQQLPKEEMMILEEEKETKEIPAGLFSKGILEGREIGCIELVWQDGRKVLEDKRIIQQIIQSLDDVEMMQEKYPECRKKECTYILELEDCTYISFEIWDACTVKSVGGYYQISEEAYQKLINRLQFRNGEENEKEL